MMGLCKATYTSWVQNKTEFGYLIWKRKGTLVYKGKRLHEFLKFVESKGKHVEYHIEMTEIIFDIEPLIEFIDSVLDPQMTSFKNLTLFQNNLTLEKVATLYRKLEEKGIDGRWIKNSFILDTEHNSAEWSNFVNYYELKEYDVILNVGVLIVKLPISDMQDVLGHWKSKINQINFIIPN